MEYTTYAKIMGLAVDEDGSPTFGYVKINGVKIHQDTLAELFDTTPDAVVLLTEEEYLAESWEEDDEDE